MDKAHKLNAPAGRPTTPAEIVDYIISAAFKMKASDVHLSQNQVTTQNPDPYLLRFRVYGKLQVVKSAFLTGSYREVIARIKVLADMPTTEVGVPLDGQLTIDVDGLPTVLRISTIPGQNAEEIVMRVQRNNSDNLSIDQLHMTDEMRGRLKKVIQQKSGLLLLNGPAGSGKTTTIYSIINTIASPEKKIITAEDPVEVRLPYVNHSQVTAKTSFASLGRAFMRQDADVIFIGEIRDEESANTALQLAQTGHLVLSTLHARDAIGAIPRLEALEVHPGNIATTLIGSLSQRLVPALCEKCRKPVSYDQETLDSLAHVMPLKSDMVFYEPNPNGCANCSKGYSGRIPIFEFFIVDADLSDAINLRKSKSELLAMARQKGMTTLAEEALLRVYAGLTDLASVLSYLVGPDYGTS